MMFRKTAIVSLITLFLSLNLVVGQNNAIDLPEVIKPSPTVANLMQFEEVPISHYTGQPNISIPLFSKGLNKDLGLGLTLQYNTQGIKVDNRSSWTGTGWSLFAGGSISRTVRGGIPDEITKGSSASGKETGVLHNDDYWNYDNLSIPDKEEFNWKAVGSSADRYDTDPDLYQFNFLNYSGRFAIVKVGSVLTPKLISKNANIKIEFNFNATTYVISSFTVTDPYGYKYVFDIIETTKTHPFSGSTPQGGVGSIPASGGSNYFNVNSAWHLSKVKTSNNVELATFNYTSVVEDYTASVSRTTNDITNLLHRTDKLINDYNVSILKPESTISYNTIQATTKKLSSIVFKDGTSVSYTLSTTAHPETGGKYLTDVIIKDENSVENKRFTLTYETTTDTSTSPTSYRLWLMKVEEKAGTLINEYQLAYNNKENLPGFDSFERDPWGYYSGIWLSVSGCTTASTYNDHTVKTGLLSSITYPTGGIKEFNFEHNSYSYLQDQAIGYDDYMQNPRNVVTQQFNGSFSYTYPSSLPLPSVIGSITLDFTQDLNIDIDVTAGNAYENIHRISLKDGNGFEKRIPMDADCYVTGIPAGAYDISLEYHDDILADPYSISGNITINYQEEAAQLDQEMIGGGVRIKDVIFKNDASGPDQKKITYTYNDETNASVSSGVLDTPSFYKGFERRYSLNKTHYLFRRQFNISSEFEPATATYSIVETGLNIELSQGNYVGYRHVKMSEQGNGYSTFSFTSPYEYPSPFGVFGLPYSSPAPNLDYKRGLPLKQKVFDNANRILKEVSNLNTSSLPDYEFTEDAIFTSRATYKTDSCPWFQFYDHYAFYENKNGEINIPTCGGQGTPCILTFDDCGLGAFTHLDTGFNSGWAKLLGSTTKDYFYDTLGNQSVTESRQTFEYNSVNFQQKRVHSYMDVSGVEKHYKTELFYPVESYPTSDYTSAQQADIAKMVVLNKINAPIYKREYVDGVIQSTSQSIYNEFHTDLVELEEIKVSKGTSSPEKRLAYHGYYSDGNIQEVSKEHGAHAVYIWGYDETLPVAKIENASYNEVSSQVSNIQNLSDLDDDHCMDSGSCKEKTLRAVLNALRDSLPNAMVTTYTYDPAVGITSVTDPKGYTSYYFYDDLNRLDSVKDADGNILSKNAYNYKQ